MKKCKQTVRLTVAFENAGTAGSQVIQLTEFEDGSVYLGGAEELIFEAGENPLKAAINYLEQKGYKKRPD